MNQILRLIEKIIPKKLYKLGQPAYHFMLALAGAVIYRFPSGKIKIVAVTGTKGKTSTVEFVNAILEEAGYKTALAGTLRFKIGDKSRANMYKMTLPGRFFLQKFLRQAVNAQCEYAVVEISSEAARQFRHKFVNLDALIFTNLAPEHIESHGGYDKYVDAKLSIARELSKSSKDNKALIVNIDDAESEKFLKIGVHNKITYSLKETEKIILSEDGLKFVYKGVLFETKLPGEFNIYNMLGAIKYAETQKIGLDIIKRAFLRLEEIKGRAQKIKVSDKQDFKVIVDYAHTPDSLIAIYEAFINSRKIGVLGNCGGGRDKWKRKAMAEIADKYCDEVILTDEDPYDDDPKEIAEDMARYFRIKKPEIIMDRREAIARAIKNTKKNDVVIITGKGTDPYIMRAGGKKEIWSDAKVAKEEVEKFLGSRF
jgi:UDP-N-acetylmuramoyl-L-alanyl-D-glutamate--2,6-diaminopimelate ligase